MAIRGCTSRSASGVPQLRQPSWMVIFRVPAFAQRDSRERLKLRGSIGAP